MTYPNFSLDEERAIFVHLDIDVVRLSSNRVYDLCQLHLLGDGVDHALQQAIAGREVEIVVLRHAANQVTAVRGEDAMVGPRCQVGAVRERVLRRVLREPHCSVSSVSLTSHMKRYILTRSES